MNTQQVVTSKTAMKYLKQLAIIFLFCLAGEAISFLLPFTFPSTIISLLLMLVCLLCKIIKEDTIKDVSDFLLMNMAFFFIPAGVEIIEHFALIRSVLIPFIIIAIVSTIAVMLVSAGAVALALKAERRFHK